MELERDRRLRIEAERIERLQALSPFIRYRAISQLPGLVPDRYEVSFSCTGLRRDGGDIVETQNHRVLIYFHAEYPTQQPRLAWMTPIFHPNIKGPRVCLGRSWTPAMTLDELCIILGEMIQYKLFNLDDPLDADAAEVIHAVIESRPDIMPIDKRNMLLPDAAVDSSQIVDDLVDLVVVE
ncbi:MAG TPA: ubiquitin-conjugating enzyme E2 [Chloroflexia bacterium]|jgi:ubiquitin-protein ligase